MKTLIIRQRYFDENKFRLKHKLRESSDRAIHRTVDALFDNIDPQELNQTYSLNLYQKNLLCRFISITCHNST